MRLITIIHINAVISDSFLVNCIFYFSHSAPDAPTPVHAVIYPIKSINNRVLSRINPSRLKEQCNISGLIWRNCATSFTLNLSADIFMDWTDLVPVNSWFIALRHTFTGFYFHLHLSASLPSPRPSPWQIFPLLQFCEPQVNERLPTIFISGKKNRTRRKIIFLLALEFCQNKVSDVNG